MSQTLFKKVDYTLNKLLADVEHGDIGLPDIQRPFVWKSSKVRDLFDSMYHGYPVGYLLFWASSAGNGVRQIGDEQKQTAPRLLIVDGQQRLTSLYAVLRGKPVVNEDFDSKHLRIAFKPSEEKFEVTNTAIEKDSEWISDISQLWSGDLTRSRFVRRFLKHLSESRELSDTESDEIEERIDQLYDIQNYPFTALELSSNINEEQVAEVFVRINSKGVELKQADFILTLMSVFWDEGRHALEEFSYRSKTPADSQASPYNPYIKPAPDQLLRVSVAKAFKRARLQYVYSILRGKDLETGEVSAERRETQFAELQNAQASVLDVQRWQDFLKCFRRGGFTSNKMITSDTMLFYCYAWYLIGYEEYQVDPFRLRQLISRWIFMCNLTKRYTGSSESAMEQDMARLRGVDSADGFEDILERTIKTALTDDFWEVTLPDQLDSATHYSPALFAYQAALNVLDATALFSDIKVSELLDPNSQGVKSNVERHHLFPKAFLKRNGVTQSRQVNQIANYAHVEWSDNLKISDSAPEEYFPHYASRFDSDTLDRMQYWHALPDRWYEMDYNDFLNERRVRIANVIREGFESLT